MHKNNFIRLFLMLSLLVPIGLVTVWGASHARPNLAWLKICINNRNTYVLGKHYLKQDSMLTCLNATTGEYKSLRLPGQSEFYPLSIGFDGEELWTLEGSRQGQHQIWVVSVPGLSIKVKSTIEDASTDGGICVVGVLCHTNSVRCRDGRSNWYSNKDRQNESRLCERWNASANFRNMECLSV